MKTQLIAKHFLFLALNSVLIPGRFFAQISITNLPYTPAVINFDSYNPSSAANTSATIPAGWSFSCTGTPVYNGITVAGTGTGGYWAYSPILTTDFDLGALRDNTTGNITYNVNYVNNTGGLITTLVFSWDYEQFRFANSSGWSCMGTGALAGNSVLSTKNLVGNSSSFLNTMVITNITFTLSGLSIADGASFGIAWMTNDDTGADNGIGIDNFSMSANATPSITLSNGVIAPDNIYQTETNHILYRTDVLVAVSPATLTSLVMNTAGTYLSSNLSNLKLWYSTNSTFSSSTATLLGTKATALGPGAKTFSGLLQKFPLGSGYLFLTADVPCSTTYSNVISVNSLSIGGITFSTGSKFTSGFTAGGNQTLAAMSMNAVSSQSACSGKQVTAISFGNLPAGTSVSWTNSNAGIGLAASGNGNISAYAAPVVSSNQAATLSATISNGACVGSSISFNVTVKNNGQSNSAWTGGISSNWSDASNWSNCSCTAATDVTITAGSFNPILNSTASVKSMNINSGATLSVESTEALNVSGNWINNGSFVANHGAVVLNGTSAQSIGGSSATSFYDLILNNSNGASLNSAQKIKGTLQLNSGVFNTNDLLTLAATSTESGKIGPINPSADIINKVTVQQLAPAGTTGWALLGTPVNSSLSMADWNDNFAITCANCPDGYYSNFTSIYTYNESIPGDYSGFNKYVPITNISNQIKPGVGYWVYLGNGATTTTDILFDVKGTVAKSSCLSCTSAVSIPLTRTSNNGTLNDGWNLVSNPLPSPISWTALRNDNPNVDDAIYVYNADLNGGRGGHASFVNGVSSNTLGGITDNIAMCQGFYVHATAPTTLLATEDVKTGDNPVFLRQGAKSVKPIVRLNMRMLNSEDETAFYFENGGTASFQSRYDAFKMIFDANVPYIASMSDTIPTSVNGLPALTFSMSIPVKAITPTTDSFTFSASKEDFPEDVCVTLYDSYTGVTTNILSNSYVCTLYDTTSNSRFMMRFFTTQGFGTGKILRQPSCGSPLGGMASAEGSGSGPWNYKWISGDTLVKTSLNKTKGDSLLNMSSGNYTVEITSVGGCDHFVKTFVIDEVVVPTASFVSDVTTTSMSNSGLVSFENRSTGSLINSWDFGDNTGTLLIPSPSHNYSGPGVYTVTLISESRTHCTDTTYQVITVLNDVTGLSSLSKSNEIRLGTLSQSQYELFLSFEEPTSVSYSLLDLKGSILKSGDLKQVTKTSESFDLESLPTGMYLLKIGISGNFEKTFKIIR